MDRERRRDATSCSSNRAVKTIMHVLLFDVKGPFAQNPVPERASVTSSR